MGWALWIHAGGVLGLWQHDTTKDLTEHLLVYLLEVICILATGHIGLLVFSFHRLTKYQKKKRADAEVDLYGHGINGQS